MSFHHKMRGLDLHAPSNEQVENSTGAVINKLQVVSLDGMGTRHPQVILANPNVRSSFGIAAEEILVGGVGLVTVVGFMFGVNTSPWVNETLLYSDVNGNLSSTPLGPPVAIVVKQDANCGVLYSLTLGDLLLEFSNPWLLDGNIGTNEDINFLGTRDTTGLQLKTDDIRRIFVDSQGRTAFGDLKPDRFIHIKAHPDKPGSGRQMDTFSVITSTAAFNNAYSFVVPDQGVVQAKVRINARQGSTNRAGFERTALFFREGGTAQFQGAMQSDFTQRSDPNFDVKFQITMDTVIFQVKSRSSDSTDWVGTVELDFLT